MSIVTPPFMQRISLNKKFFEEEISQSVMAILFRGAIACSVFATENQDFEIACVRTNMEL